MAVVRARGCRDRPRRAVHAAERARPRLGVAGPAVPQRGVAAAEHDNLDARPRNCATGRRIFNVMHLHERHSMSRQLATDIVNEAGCGHAQHGGVAACAKHDMVDTLVAVMRRSAM